MKRLFLPGIKILYYSFFITYVLSACKDEIKDTTNPMVSFTNLTDNQKLKGTFTLQLNATDDQNIDRVVLSIDNTEVATFSNGETLEFELNTNNYDEGTHTCSATAFDASGNSGSIEVPFTVRNTMLSIDINDYFDDPAQSGYIIIYDMEGSVVDYKKMENNTSFEFLYPENYDGFDFNVGQFFAYEEDTYKYYTSYTVLQCSSTHWTYNGNEDNWTGFNQDLKFTNIPDHDYAIVSNGFRHESFAPLYDYSLYTKWDPDNIFVSLYSGTTATYKWIENAPAGETIIDLSQTDLMTKNQINTQEPISYLKVFGNLEISGEVRSYQLNASITSQYFYAPGFDSYTTWMGVASDFKEYYVLTTGDPVTDFAGADFNVDISSADNNSFTLSHSGDFDIYYADWYYAEYSDIDIYVDWFTIGGQEDDNPVRFEVPDEILNAYPSLDPSQLEPGEVIAMDIDAIDGYDEIVDSETPDFVYFNSPIQDGTYYYLIPDLNGGRIAQGISQGKKDKQSLMQAFKERKSAYNH